jgi:hypothetical protein
MIDTYRAGVAAVVAGIFALMFMISVLEVLCELSGAESIKRRVERWAERKPWFARLFVFLWLVLLAHFFLNPLPSLGL